MHGLSLTYETLANTRNEAAIDVLLAAFSDDDPAVRRRALSAMLSRNEQRSSELVLENWDLLQADDLRVLQQKKNWMEPAIAAALEKGGDDVSRAIEAAKALGLTAVIPQIVMLAESSASRVTRSFASDCVIDMVTPLGREARRDRDQQTVRGPVLARLADSVRRFSMHRNEKLIDAFLLIVTWGDADFRNLMGERSPQLELICKRLSESKHVGINDLLAGFVRRRNLPESIARIIQNRDGEEFRDSLLRNVGNEPTGTALRNLGDIGMPVCCRGGETLMRELPPEYRAALAHISTATATEPLDNLHTICTAVECGGPGCDSTAALCFSRSDVPDVKIWMRAAVPVADGNQEAIAENDNARLLQRLIDLLDHPEPSVVKGVRKILGPLHTEEMLHKFDTLRPRTRRKLGRIVMNIDPDAIDRVRDALRHPVLNNRLAAIATADAFAVVDLLSDSFKHISREDHQEARMRAAEAMSSATSDETLELLREMVELPESPVRDAAVAALEARESSSAS